jgi:nitrite reductase (NO-forming)
MSFINGRRGFWAIGLTVVALLVGVLAGGLYFVEGHAQAAGAQGAAAAPAEQTGGPTTHGLGTGVGDTQMPAGQSHQVAQQGPVPGVKNTTQQAAMVPDISFTLRSDVGQKGLSFVGVGGTIDGQVNPKLEVPVGAVVQVTLVNGDGALHDVVVPDFGGASEQIAAKGSSSTFVFKADKAGQFPYFCSVPGHRQAGMEGQLVVGQAAVVEETGADIVMDPAKVAAPVGSRGPQNLKVALETVELKGQLADGTTYNYWTFNSTVPGPMIRVRVGDTVEVSLTNDPGSQMVHSVDFHAVTGPGGGATVTQVPPGQTKSFTFKALNPGVYVYHCATPMVAHHITNGMYGLIVVEPEGGMPRVDREFYVMQGELYTQAAYGQHGYQTMSVDKLLAEQPEYLTFNGAVGALTEKKPLKAKVGETVRIFFGVGGPNKVSSFHVIGEIFDRVYDQASLTTAPLTDVQTTVVPAGGAAVVEFKLDVPGRYVLVDHSLSRMERGLVGFLIAEGAENPDVFHSEEMPQSAGH